VKLRSVIVALLSFWFAFGPLATVWAQSVAADEPCESMNMSMPMQGHDCCGDMDQAKCLSICLSAAPAIAFSALRLDPMVAVAAAVPASSTQHASILAPPDAAPPKLSVS
jgi:hypothetical protein